MIGKFEYQKKCDVNVCKQEISLKLYSRAVLRPSPVFFSLGFWVVLQLASTGLSPSVAFKSTGLSPSVAFKSLLPFSFLLRAGALLLREKW